MHLHFIFQPTAAIVASALSARALLYMVADYRSTLYRPPSMGNTVLFIQCGSLAADVVIPYSMMESVDEASGPVRRCTGVRRHTQFGAANVLIGVKPGSQLPDLFGRPQTVEHGLSEPGSARGIYQESARKAFRDCWIEFNSVRKGILLQ